MKFRDLPVGVPFAFASDRIVRKMDVRSSMPEALSGEVADITVYVRTGPGTYRYVSWNDRKRYPTGEGATIKVLLSCPIAGLDTEVELLEE